MRRCLRIPHLSLGYFSGHPSFAQKGYHWRHIVEQHEANIARFGAQMVHNEENLIQLPANVHYEINAMYHSFNIRQAISQMSFGQQYAEGLKVLQDLDQIPY